MAIYRRFSDNKYAEALLPVCRKRSDARHHAWGADLTSLLGQALFLMLAVSQPRCPSYRRLASAKAWPAKARFVGLAAP